MGPDRKYHHGNLKAAVVRAAVRRLADSPTQEMTIRDLAQDVGTSHVAIYRHFGSKREVMAEIGIEGFRAFVASKEERQQSLPEDATPHEILVELSRHYVEFALANAGHFRAMFHKDLHPRGDFPDLCDAGAAAFTTVLESTAAFLGSSDPLQAFPQANMVWGQVHGIAILVLDEQLGGPMSSDGMDPATLAAEAVDTWCLGWRARTSSTPRTN